MHKTPKDHSAKTKQGLERAAALGRVGGRRPKVSDEDIRAAIPLGTADGARKVGLTISSFIRRRRLIEAANVQSK